MNTRSIRLIRALWAVLFVLSLSCGNEKTKPPADKDSRTPSQASPVVSPSVAKRVHPTTVAAPKITPFLGVGGFAPTRALRVPSGARVRFDLLDPSFRGFGDDAIGE